MSRAPLRVAFEIFSVGHQDENSVGAASAAQRGLGFAYGARDIGAAAGDGIGVDGVQRFMKGAVVQRDGADQEGAAGEGDQTDGIAIQLIGKVVDGEFGAREPVGFDIRRRHAA